MRVKLLLQKCNTLGILKTELIQTCWCFKSNKTLTTHALLGTLYKTRHIYPWIIKKKINQALKIHIRNLTDMQKNTERFNWMTQYRTNALLNNQNRAFSKTLLLTTNTKDNMLFVLLSQTQDIGIDRKIMFNFDINL